MTTITTTACVECEGADVNALLASPAVTEIPLCAQHLNMAPETIEANLKLGFVLRNCPKHGLTSAESDLAHVSATDEKVDYCQQGEHFVNESEWLGEVPAS